MKRVMQPILAVPGNEPYSTVAYREHIERVIRDDEPPPETRDVLRDAIEDYFDRMLVSGIGPNKKPYDDTRVTQEAAAILAVGEVVANAISDLGSQLILELRDHRRLAEISLDQRAG